MVKHEKNKRVIKLFKRGLDSLASKNFDNAEKYFKKVLKIDPTNKSALNNLGIISFVTRDYIRAYNYFSATLQIDENNMSALIHLGMVSIFLKKKIREGKKYIIKAYRLFMRKSTYDLLYDTSFPDYINPLIESLALIEDHRRLVRLFEKLHQTLGSMEDILNFVSLRYIFNYYIAYYNYYGDYEFCIKMLNELETMIYEDYEYDVVNAIRKYKQILEFLKERGLHVNLDYVIYFGLTKLSNLLLHGMSKGPPEQGYIATVLLFIAAGVQEYNRTELIYDLLFSERDYYEKMIILSALSYYQLDDIYLLLLDVLHNEKFKTLNKELKFFIARLLSIYGYIPLNKLKNILDKNIFSALKDFTRAIEEKNVDNKINLLIKSYKKFPSLQTFKALIDTIIASLGTRKKYDYNFIKNRISQLIKLTSLYEKPDELYLDLSLMLHILRINKILDQNRLNEIYGMIPKIDFNKIHPLSVFDYKLSNILFESLIKRSVDHKMILDFYSLINSKYSLIIEEFHEFAAERLFIQKIYDSYKCQRTNFRKKINPNYSLEDFLKNYNMEILRRIVASLGLENKKGTKIDYIKLITKHLKNSLPKIFSELTRKEKIALKYIISKGGIVEFYDFVLKFDINALDYSICEILDIKNSVLAKLLLKGIAFIGTLNNKRVIIIPKQNLKILQKTEK
ncbi:MAG: hypothetical protein ABGF52_06970 [Candidatus Asgardarchaeum sp.]